MKFVRTPVVDSTYKVKKKLVTCLFLTELEKANLEYTRFHNPIAKADELHA